MPAMARKMEAANKLKVFWFFSSEKNMLAFLHRQTMPPNMQRLMRAASHSA
jgi:hypothetical protein